MKLTDGTPNIIVGTFFLFLLLEFAFLKMVDRKKGKRKKKKKKETSVMATHRKI